MHASSAYVVIASLALLVAARPAAAQVSNSDIYETVGELADEAELIRERMGRPFDDSGRLPLSAISTFELYFQVETLFVAANRLAYELADAEPRFPPPLPAGEITAADVKRLADAALASIRLVRDSLGFTEPVTRVDRSTPITPTGVFSVVLDTNRQLDLLLNDSFSSADVHQRLIVASTLAAGVLASLGVPSPQPAPFDEPKLPADVDTLLFDVLDLATTVVSRAGIDVLTLSTRRNVPEDTRPADVYHLAQFLVADLAALARARDADPVALEFGMQPRHVFPLHSYRLALLLQRQIEALDAAMR